MTKQRRQAAREFEQRFNSDFDRDVDSFAADFRYMMGGVVRTVDVNSTEAKNNVKAQEALTKELTNIKEKESLDFDEDLVDEDLVDEDFDEYSILPLPEEDLVDETSSSESEEGLLRISSCRGGSRGEGAQAGAVDRVSEDYGRCDVGLRKMADSVSALLRRFVSVGAREAVLRRVLRARQADGFL